MPDQETAVILRHDAAELAHVSPGDGGYINGRGHNADISVDLPRIGDRHARLTITTGEVLVEDLGSPNGTFVGDEPANAARRGAAWRAALAGAPRRRADRDPAGQARQPGRARVRPSWPR